MVDKEKRVENAAKLFRALEGSDPILGFDKYLKHLEENNIKSREVLNYLESHKRTD